jgi:hypothetical protein
MPDLSTALKTAPKFDRAPVARGLESDFDGVIGLDETGGDNGAGLISGFAVITRAEALGHGFWIDDTMLQQTADAINATGEAGIKSRFTHPGLSGDGLGSFLGRVKNAVVDGDIVRADLHFSASAHDTPDGDLAAYVMSLASEDPDAFGTSIVFRHDNSAEAKFAIENGATANEYGVDMQSFKSPDPLNADNLPHARLKSLRAADVVDEPAANPGGMFHRGQEIAEDADALLSFALGLTKDKPVLAELSIDPDRVSGHVARFLSQHGLSLVPAQEAPLMADDNKQPTPPVPSRADFAAELDQFTSKFGAAKGVEWFKAGKSMTEALGLFTDDLQKQLAASEKQIETLSAEKSDLEKQLAKAKAESAPLVEFSNSDDDDDRDELADGDDAQAESLWKAHADLRDEFTGKFSAFKAAFTKSPEDFADFN